MRDSERTIRDFETAEIVLVGILKLAIMILTRANLGGVRRIRTSVQRWEAGCLSDGRENVNEFHELGSADARIRLSRHCHHQRSMSGDLCF